MEIPVPHFLHNIETKLKMLNSRFPGRPILIIAVTILLHVTGSSKFKMAAAKLEIHVFTD